MPFPTTLVCKEMQTVLSRIWTQFVKSISYFDNCYAPTPQEKFNAFLNALNRIIYF